MKTLSGLVITRDAEDRIEGLIDSMRLFADEVVAVVDADSSDGTYDLCRRFADVCVVKETPQHLPESILEEAYGLCSGDWALRIDDDELISEAILTLRDQLLDARDGVNAFAFPHYALIGDERHYIKSKPWFPDFQVRAFRKGMMTQSKVMIHWSSSPKSGRIALMSALQIFHYKFLVRSRQEREAQWEWQQMVPCYRDIEWFRPWYPYEDYDYEVREIAERPLEGKGKCYAVSNDTAGL